MASNRPTTAELLTAVREFLDEEAMEAIAAGNVRFKLRVALNVLKLVEREVELGPRYQREEIHSLQALLASDEPSLTALNAELCDRIRRGDYDAEGDERHALLGHLQSATLHKLAIDNPTYSTFRGLTEADAN